MTFELKVLDFIQDLSHPILDKFWVFVTHLGDGGIGLIICGLLLMAFKKTRKIGFMCILAIALGALVTNLTLKNLIQRARPFEGTDFSLLIKAPKDYSFPSGHTTASFAMAFTVIRAKLKIKGLPMGWLGLGLASLIAFSRLYLYVHYPTDILAGILVGYGAALVAYDLVEGRQYIKVFNNRKKDQ